MMLNFNLISRFCRHALNLCVCERESRGRSCWRKGKMGKKCERANERVNEKVRKTEIRCKLKNNSESHWSPRLLNRVQEHSNVIPSQFHNPSISATLSLVHPLSALALYLFSTYKITVGYSSAGVSGETSRHRGEYKVTLCNSDQLMQPCSKCLCAHVCEFAYACGIRASLRIHVH